MGWREQLIHDLSPWGQIAVGFMFGFIFICGGVSSWRKERMGGGRWYPGMIVVFGVSFVVVSGLGLCLVLTSNWSFSQNNAREAIEQHHNIPADPMRGLIEQEIKRGQMDKDQVFGHDRKEPEK